MDLQDFRFEMSAIQTARFVLHYHCSLAKTDPCEQNFAQLFCLLGLCPYLVALCFMLVFFLSNAKKFNEKRNSLAQHEIVITSRQFEGGQGRDAMPCDNKMTKRHTPRCKAAKMNQN